MINLNDESNFYYIALKKWNIQKKKNLQKGKKH